MDNIQQWDKSQQNLHTVGNIPTIYNFYLLTWPIPDSIYLIVQALYAYIAWSFRCHGITIWDAIDQRQQGFNIHHELVPIYDIYLKWISNSNLMESHCPIHTFLMWNSNDNMLRVSQYNCWFDTNFLMSEPMRRYLWADNILQDLCTRWIQDGLTQLWL